MCRYMVGRVLVLLDDLGTGARLSRLVIVMRQMEMGTRDPDGQQDQGQGNER
jgi:hypothetical protein